MNQNNKNNSLSIDKLEDFKIPMSYKLRCGETRYFELNEEALKPFGFHFGDRIIGKEGKTGWVIGVRSGEKGEKNIFFHMDDESGASYCNGYTKDKFEKEGIKLQFSPKDLYQKQKKESFLEFFNNKKFSDLTLEIQDEKIPVHKLLLSLRSKYFHNLLLNSETNKLVLKISNKESFMILLKFIYTGILNTLKL
jgi:hypothetical protein